MKLHELFTLVTQIGIDADPCGRAAVEQDLIEVRSKSYDDLKQDEKAVFDSEKFENSHTDRRILYGAHNRKIKKIFLPESILKLGTLSCGPLESERLQHRPCGGTSPQGISFCESLQSNRDAGRYFESIRSADRCGRISSSGPHERSGTQTLAGKPYPPGGYYLAARHSMRLFAYSCR